MELVNPNNNNTGDNDMATATKKAATKKAAAKSKAPDQECQCMTEPVPGKEGTYGSCGRVTRGRFAPGHDAKLKSLLIKHAVAGTKFKVWDGKKAVTVDPDKRAAELGWSKFTDRAKEVAAEKAEKAEKRAAEREAAKAEKAKAKKAAAAKKATAKAE
jgi:hypothetical protein